MDRRQWEEAKAKAWLELRHAGYAVSGARGSNLYNDVGFADQKLHDAAVEYARVVRAEPAKGKDA